VRGAALRVTVSFGPACVSSVVTTEDLVSQADRALYSAKKAGRNRSYYFSGDGYDPACLVSANEAANEAHVGEQDDAPAL
jgi:predicted signal transduction protein with EAL and GGDEF domain